MLASVLKSGLLLAGVSGVAVSSQVVQDGFGGYRTSPPPVAQSASLQYVIGDWKRLQQSDRYPFTDYANFMLAHPGWPGETGRRAAAETTLGSGVEAPSLVTRYFDRFPPLTAAGRVRFAEALAVSGRRAEADEQARRAWRSGSLRPADETALMSSFPGAIGPADHDARMDALLWQDARAAAARQLGFTSPQNRAVFDARLALRSNWPDASVKAAAAEALGSRDPGFIADRASWYRNNGASGSARSLLARPRALASLPGNVEKWYEVLLTNARAAEADGQYSLAYDIASRVDDALPPGAEVSDMSLGIRDDYTSLVWLAGTLALQKLRRPADAMAMFDRYSRGSRTPTTQSKGLYWAGRAAEAAGQASTAQTYYQRAAAFSDLYYGQLAAERTGLALKAPPAFNPAAAAPAARAAFFNREVVRAAQYLGQTGQYQDQGLFLRQIAADATSAEDHILATELSRSIGRPDLGVMVGRSALLNGLTDYTVAGYPSVAVPPGEESYFTIIHAIARQESQFDRAAVSRVGARGLMQLMPGTARETAGKLGLGYDLGALTSDTGYNIRLGSSYFQRMLSYYGGSYPLAVAAYNAGPGNVNKWLRANGDPRAGSIGMIEWVEAIPIFETKNYVQRVLENAVVYDLLHPQRARSRGDARISWYLGKSRPG
ncbi:lytic transglycosylase domain-containing protein [Sphingomonas sp. MG17]|uniref:Lytic transglycosylase domain-containing protein n=1 Tax=Sphingomonas tagetis TaxID=2949092 RepID=A0A9X2KJT3_9SPHN|nr:lytic transglycosylase domain-containing protein [Sphingomonas tagetis]MCP3728892.1 lytic transglycosylase domain-containing protein [Sphingomonas tagetis]